MKSRQKGPKLWQCHWLPGMRNTFCSARTTCRGLETVSILVLTAPLLPFHNYKEKHAFTCCHTPATCFTIFRLLNKYHLSPQTPHLPLFPSHCSHLDAPAAQRTWSFVHQSCARSHWYPLCAVGSVAKKRTVGEQKTGETGGGGGEKGASAWAVARFSRWGYLLCPVNLRHGVDVHCAQHAYVCTDKCVSASLAVHQKPACKGQLLGRFKSICGGGWMKVYCISTYSYSAGSEVKKWIKYCNFPD